MFNLFQKKKQGVSKELKGLMENFQLPTFPTAVMSVLSLLRDPESAPADIAMQIELDPGMHVKVLKIVNSAAFGLTSEVANVGHATSLLGRARLESLVLSMAVKDALPSPDMHGFNVAHFWLSAARRASLARALAQRLHPATQAEAFSAGLLQDIAIPILVEIKKEAYIKIYQDWQASEEGDLRTQEIAAFGYDHAEAGALIIDEWELPEYLKIMTRGHHDEESDEVEPAVRIVSYIRDSEENIGLNQVIEACTEIGDIDPETARTIVEQSFADAEQFAKTLE